MPGDPDPEYVRARRALLDVLDALIEHRDAIVLVGAQAIYLHTGDANLTVAEFTTDADIAIHPRDLDDSPLISEALADGGFDPQADVGRWLSSDGVYVDIMVPEALAGPGALLVAKAHKIAERRGSTDRIRDKDALDVLRLLRAVPTAMMVERLTLLAGDEHAGPVTSEARSQISELFVAVGAEGTEMAVRAAGSDEDPETIAASMVALANELLDLWH